jgi:hypothetical protein
MCCQQEALLTPNNILQMRMSYKHKIKNQYWGTIVTLAGDDAVIFSVHCPLERLLKSLPPSVRPCSRNNS